MPSENSRSISQHASSIQAIKQGLLEQITPQRLIDLEDTRSFPEIFGSELVHLLLSDLHQEIYRTRYWNVMRCDDLPAGVDLVVFDFGVNANARQSAKTLQQVVGAADDGSIGDATIGAMKAMSPRDIVRDMSSRRIEFYRGSSQAPSALTIRANAIEKAALEMIGGPPGSA